MDNGPSATSGSAWPLETDQMPSTASSHDPMEIFNENTTSHEPVSSPASYNDEEKINCRPKKLNDDDLFDAALFYEDTFIEKGRQEGHIAGLAKGRADGRLIGTRHGRSLGEEIGFYLGFVNTWLDLLGDRDQDKEAASATTLRATAAGASNVTQDAAVDSSAPPTSANSESVKQESGVGGSDSLLLSTSTSSSSSSSTVTNPPVLSISGAAVTHHLKRVTPVTSASHSKGGTNAAKALDQLQLLRSLLASFRFDNPEDPEMDDRLSAIRTKFRGTLQ